jgi:phenylalanyl-tRNA synthetase beta chain
MPLNSKRIIPYEKLLEAFKRQNIPAELVFETEVPSFRSFDIGRDVDLIEEVLRIYGYTNVGDKRPLLPLNTQIAKPFEEKIRDFLTARGLSEVITFPWLEKKLVELFNLKSPWEVVNPLSEEQRFLRTSLVPSLVKVLKFNWNNFNRDLAIFELGKIYLEEGEFPTLGLLAFGRINYHFAQTRDWDFLTFKGVIQALFERLGISDFKIEPSKVEYMHPYLCADIKIGDTRLGYFGKLHPQVAQALELPATPFVGEIDLEKLSEFSKKPYYRGISKFPPVKRDFALVFEEGVQKTEEILNTAKEVFGELLESLYVFDVYRGEKIGEGKISVAVRVILRHPEKSLSDEEVNRLSDKFVKKLNEKGFSLRA